MDKNNCSENNKSSELEYRLQGMELHFIRNELPIGYHKCANTPEYDFLFIGDSFVRLTGYTRQEIKDIFDNKFKNMVHPDDWNEIFVNIQKKDGHFDEFNEEYRIKTKQGYVWVLDRTKFVSYGDVEYYQGTAVNIDNNIRMKAEYEETVRKQTETSSMLEKIVDANSCGIFAYTLPERRILQINKEALRLFDLDEDIQITGENVSFVIMNKINEEDKRVLLGTVKRLENIGDTVNYTYRIKCRDGEIKKVQVFSRLLETTGGEKMILSSLLDITEKSIMEELFRQERHQYRDALVNDCIYAYVFDITDGYIRRKPVVKGRKEFEDILGFKFPVCHDEIVKYWAELTKPQFLNGMTPDMLTSEYYLQSYNEGKRSLESEYYETESKTYRRITVLLSENERNGHVLACVIAKDITAARMEEQKAKKMLEEALAQAQYANKAKTRFLSNMSHDIRTPMNAIVGYSSIAAAYIEDKLRVQDCLNKIISAGSHLQALINDILDMSRIESGKMVLHEKECNIRQIIEKLADIINIQIVERKLEFETDISGVRNYNVLADELKLNQILLNIVGNAIKFTLAGGNIYLKVKQYEAKKDGYAGYEFLIRDTGIGMSEQFIEHIYEPFERENTTTISGVKGSGLGMAITKNIVDVMQGSIEVKSQPDIGSDVVVRLELKLANNEEELYESSGTQNNKEQSSETQSSEVQSKKIQSYEGKSSESISSAEGKKSETKASAAEGDICKGKRILIVEDNKMNMEIAHIILNDAGFITDMAYDGKEAVELIEASPEYYYDLILMDIQMPVMNGYEAAGIIRNMKREDTSKLPIIAMTANAFEEDREKAFASGMNEHMAKPLNLDEMIKITKIWLTK